LTKAFASPLQVIPLTSSSDGFSGMSVSADGLSAIVSVSDSTTNSYDLKLYSRSSIAVSFGNATTFPGAANINSAGQEIGPRLTRDGLNLFWGRGSMAGASIYLSTRATNGDSFPAGSVLDRTTINSEAFALAPWVSKDNTAIYWSLGDSARSIYTAQITAAGFVNRALVTTRSQAGFPVLTDDLLTMYVASNAPDTGTTVINHRIWKFSRSTTLASWSTPVVLSELNDTKTTYSYDVSADGCILYYSKDGLVYQIVKPR
jgi:hypothetical protein